MNFDDLFRHGFGEPIIYDPQGDRILFRGKVYTADDEDDDLAYLGTDDRISDLLRDIRRGQEPSDIERMEDLLWETMQAFLDFKKKLP